MEYNMNEYEYDQKQQMHSILDNGLNKLRQSFDKGSVTSQSMTSSRQSPSIRKKSQLRQVLEEMKSNTSSVAQYNEDTQFGYFNPSAQNSNTKNESSVTSTYDFPGESPMKTQGKTKRQQMQSELDLLQK